MKLGANKKIKIFLWAGLGFLSAGFFLFSSQVKPKNPLNPPLLPVDITDLPPLVEKLPLGHPKLEWSLFNLTKIYRDSGLEEAKKFAVTNRLDIFEDSIRVLVESETAGILPSQIQTTGRVLETQINSLGGQVETSHKAYVQSRLPLTMLENLANLPTVRFVRRLPRPHLDVTSQGVSQTGANNWHSLLPFHPSRTVKVAVLDYGFQGYQDLLGTELPENVTTRAFGTNLEGDHVHGTACAEIVYDMAPEVELYLVHPASAIDFRNAVDWLIAEEVDVITHSASWLNMSPGDGTGYILDGIQEAAMRGIVWANSAGNYGQRHWAGTFNDPDEDGWHNFSGGDEICSFETYAGYESDIFLRWNDWGGWNGFSYGGSDQDFDLYLYFYDGTDYQYVIHSGDTQNGVQWPTEYVGMNAQPTDTKWGMAVRKVSATKNVYFDAILISTFNVEYNVPAGSLTAPADSAYCLAVGATDAFDDSLHSYSSRGPTLDGRIKPDIAAPSGVSTSSYGTDGFYGTSASSPHLAGAVALLMSKTPYDGSQVVNIILSHALDYGPPGKDNMYGYGRLNLRR